MWCCCVVSEGDGLETGVWFIEEPPEDVIPHRGSEVVLNCTVSTSSEFPAANITWRKNGQTLTVGGPDQRRTRLRVVNGSLVIRRVQARSDNGFYQCAAAVEGLGILLSRITRLHVAGELHLPCYPLGWSVALCKIIKFI